MTLYVPLEGILDFNKEMQRLGKELMKMSKELGQISKKLNNDDFFAKAPPEVVAKVKEKEKTLLEKQEKIEDNIRTIRKISS